MFTLKSANVALRSLNSTDKCKISRKYAYFTENSVQKQL